MEWGIGVGGITQQACFQISDFQFNIAFLTHEIGEGRKRGAALRLQS